MASSPRIPKAEVSGVALPLAEPSHVAAPA